MEVKRKVTRTSTFYDWYITTYQQLKPKQSLSKLIHCSLVRPHEVTQISSTNTHLVYMS